MIGVVFKGKCVGGGVVQPHGAHDYMPIWMMDFQHESAIEQTVSLQVLNDELYRNCGTQLRHVMREAGSRIQRIERRKPNDSVGGNCRGRHHNVSWRVAYDAFICLIH